MFLYFHIKNILLFSGLKSTGTKAELLNRLMNGEITPVKITEIEAKPSKNVIRKTEYESMTLASLKIICKEKGLKGVGKKAEVIERLNIYDSTMNLPVVHINKSEDEDISIENALNIADNNHINIDNNNNNNNNSDINNNNNNNNGKLEDNNKINKKSNVNDDMFNMYNAMTLNVLKDICLTKYLPDIGDKRQLIESLLADQNALEEVVDYDFSSFYKEALAEQMPLFVATPKTKKYREIK